MTGTPTLSWSVSGLDFHTTNVATGFFIADMGALVGVAGQLSNSSYESMLIEQVRRGQ
jgi:hypothetical protein